jgi:hypothetical protein
MRVAIHQPYYLPWLGWFHKMWAVDLLVFFDDVQFTKGRFNRAEVLLNGKRTWLTVPVRRSRDTTIQQAQVVEGAWPRKHEGTVRQAYANAEYGAEAADAVAALLRGCAQPWLGSGLSLSSMTTEMTMAMAAKLKIGTEVAFSSELEYDRATAGTDRIVEVCKAVGADDYVSGTGGCLEFIEKDKFDRAGMRVEWQSFQGEEYPQVGGGAAFEAGLSVVDVVANMGWDYAEAYVKRCGRVRA